MRRPRILIFSLAYFPFVGGAEVAVKEITDRLADKFEFEVINADIKNFWSKYLYPIWACRRAVRQHRTKNYDLVWAIMANQAGMAATLFKRRPQWDTPRGVPFSTLPFLLTLQEGDDLDSLAYRARLLGPRLFGVFRRADHITAISHYLARWARQMGARCSITVVPNGVNIEKFEVRGEKLNRKEKIIITTSRLVKKNGVDVLIEAMRFLPENIRLVIVGSGPEESFLKQLTSRLNLDKRVEFLGAVSPIQIPDCLGRADVFCRPARSEGLGNSFLEAMAAGVPVVGTPVGGIPDFLKDGKTGWFCEVNNPQSIADKVQYILDPANIEKVAEVKEEAKRLVEEKYNWNTIAQEMAQIMDNLAKKS
ncbi:MAG: glycosyltransferase family 4 protein [Candidatus Vogelbacteria bacterium]|nr:glycosyltransferase family 4 protein [Candidatus Vogelbacteria bacterium]